MRQCGNTGMLSGYVVEALRFDYAVDYRNNWVEQCALFICSWNSRSKPIGVF